MTDPKTGPEVPGGEWWPELGPQWKPTTAQKPQCLCIDVHSHLAVAESAAVAKPHFKPEMDPRSFFSPPESNRYNTELRMQPHQVAKYHEPEARIEDMDKQGIDMQLLSVVPCRYSL